MKTWTQLKIYKDYPKIEIEDLIDYDETLINYDETTYPKIVTSVLNDKIFTNDNHNGHNGFWTINQALGGYYIWLPIMIMEI